MIETVESWRARGELRELAGLQTFTVDLGPIHGERHEPVLILHGFPTCSFDFRDSAERLSTERRVLLLDMIGFGLSSKPDLRYSIELQADVVTALVQQAGLSSFALVTHDMGDTVGGEILAREMEGGLSATITRRVLTNGSIYIGMAKLSAGQLFLLDLPDEPLDETLAPDSTTMSMGLRATFSAASEVDDDELRAAWELISYQDGHRMLPRTIRYIEDRRLREQRYTGAIETHPSPLSIIWGADDPIAVTEMATKLSSARPEAKLTIMTDVGHYPMIESPDAFFEALSQALH